MRGFSECFFYFLGQFGGIVFADEQGMYQEISSEIVNLIALSLTKGLSLAKARQFWLQTASREQAHELKREFAWRFPDKACILEVAFEEALKKAQFIVKDCLKFHIHIITFLSVDYPVRLLMISDAPLVLYARGNKDVLQSPHTLGVIGSRRMTAYGERLLRDFIPVWTSAELIIVSGLAFGVDSWAHHLCVKSGGKTLAVQAQGVKKGYPRGIQSIYDEIIKNNGLVISEFHDEAVQADKRFLFPRRNRLISGLSQGVIVIEADLKSGSLITARMALEQNRDVMAIPARLDDERSRGCLALLQEGAHMILSAEDVLTVLGVLSSSKDVITNADKLYQHKNIENPLLSFDSESFQWGDRTQRERQILELCRTATSLEDILEQCGENAGSIMATVTALVIKGDLTEKSPHSYQTSLTLK